jgi:hypothetical protein
LNVQGERHSNQAERGRGMELISAILIDKLFLFRKELLLAIVIKSRD